MLQKLGLALKACRIISNLSNDLIITVNIYTAEICLIYISSHFFKLANNSGFMNRSIILEEDSRAVKGRIPQQEGKKNHALNP